MLKWRLVEEAQADIGNIRSFTKQQWGTVQSTQYLRDIRKKIELLAQNPDIGIDRSEELSKGMRSAFVGSHAIYYKCDSKTLIVYAILHQSMIPSAHLLPKQD